MKKLSPLGFWPGHLGSPATPGPSHLANTNSVLHGSRLGSFPELWPKRLACRTPHGAQAEGNGTHGEERVPGVLENPALSDRVGDFILQTEARGGAGG